MKRILAITFFLILVCLLTISDKQIYKGVFTTQANFSEQNSDRYEIVSLDRSSFANPKAAKTTFIFKIDNTSGSTWFGATPKQFNKIKEPTEKKDQPTPNKGYYKLVSVNYRIPINNVDVQVVYRVNTSTGNTWLLEDNITWSKCIDMN